MSNVFFKNSVSFSGATFNNSSDFSWAIFNNSADFTLAKFNDAAEFIGPETSEKLILDGKNFQKFYKYYNDRGRYADADVVYYNYRQSKLRKEKWNDSEFWWDFLSWLTCGFGVKPLYTIFFGIAVIFLFSGIYVNPICLKSLTANVYWDIKSNKILPFALKNPGIVRDRDQDQKIYLTDIIYYSFGCFTFMSHDNWYPRDSFKKLVALEGALGWLILGIFMATLSKVIIRI